MQLVRGSGWHSAVGGTVRWVAQCGRIPYQQCFLPPGVLHTFECDDVISREPTSAECYLHQEDTRGLLRPLPPPPLQIHRSNPSASTNRFSGEGKGFLRPTITYMQATFAPCENPMMPSNGLCSISTATGWASQTCRVIYSLFEQCAQRRQETVHGGGGVVGGGMSPALLTLAPQRCRGCTA